MVSQSLKCVFHGLDDWCDSEQGQELYSAMSDTSFLSHGSLKL